MRGKLNASTFTGRSFQSIASDTGSNRPVLRSTTGNRRTSQIILLSHGRLTQLMKEPGTAITAGKETLYKICLN